MRTRALASKVRRAARSVAAWDLGGGPADAVLVAGSARSGTTWVSDIINHQNEYRYIFEPLHPSVLPAGCDCLERKYLRPDEDAPALLRFMNDVFSGRIHNAWVNGQNRKRIARRRLVKTIRTNLMLKWIRVHFPNMPIVLLLRHPCAVANSRLRIGWPDHLDEMLAQDTLMQDFLDRHRIEIQATGDPFERQIIQWCVETAVALRQLEDGDVYLAFYELFCTDPQKEVRALLDFLGRKPTEKVWTRLGRPSKMSGTHSAVMKGGSLIDSWRERVSAGQVQHAVDILRRFDLDAIYGEASLPHPEGALAILRGGRPAAKNADELGTADASPSVAN
ncbi:MAG: sulfotransferase domain-containing protein [Planctomycetota bacterium]|jgi:hypothetical protein